MFSGPERCEASRAGEGGRKEGNSGGREKGKGKEWKFHKGLGKVHSRTNLGADRDTKVIREAAKGEGRAGWISMDPVPR